MDLKKTGRMGVNWIPLAHNTVKAKVSHYKPEVVLGVP
jgi:hypothetical protein